MALLVCSRKRIDGVLDEHIIISKKLKANKISEEVDVGKSAITKRKLVTLTGNDSDNIGQISTFRYS